MTMTESTTDRKDGRVVGIAGPVVDVEFPRGALPELNSAVEFEITLEGETVQVLAEVAQQLGEGRVRAVCLKPTDGLVRGAPVRNLGHGITVPVGDKVLGGRSTATPPTSTHSSRRLGCSRRVSR
jgi:F-type H+-transporting ATPase subunit beta